MADDWTLYTSDSGRTWQPTRDRDLILAHDNSQLIFGVHDRAEAVARLDEKFPTDHPLLSRLVVKWQYHRSWNAPNQQLLADDQIGIYDPEYARVYNPYTGGRLADTQIAALIELVKSRKEVSVDCHAISPYALAARCSLRIKLRDAGIVVKLGYRSYNGPEQKRWTTLRWNPKGIKAAIKGAATRQANYRKEHPERTYLIGDVALEVHQIFRDTLGLGLTGYTTGPDSYSAVLETLGSTISLFNMLFGRHAHRKLVSFHELVKAWPTSVWRERHLATFEKRADNSTDRQRKRKILPILKWLDIECTKKLPRACKRFSPLLRPSYQLRPPKSKARKQGKPHGTDKRGETKAARARQRKTARTSRQRHTRAGRNA